MKFLNHIRSMLYKNNYKNLTNKDLKLYILNLIVERFPQFNKEKVKLLYCSKRDCVDQNKNEFTYFEFIYENVIYILNNDSLKSCSDIKKLKCNLYEEVSL